MIENLRIVEADFGQSDQQTAVLMLLSAYAADPMGNNEALPSSAAALLIPRLRDEPKILTLLAYVESKPVGIAICFRGFSTEADSPLLTISDFCVLPEHRGQGIGRRLLDFIEHMAREMDCPRLILKVREDNHPALRLYHSAGFAHIPSDEPTGIIGLAKEMN